MRIKKNKKLILVNLFALALLFAACEKEIFTGVEETALVNNRIFIESNPTNALIYLNNKNSGLKTPTSLTWLADGKHSITLKHQYFIDTTITLTLNGGQETKLLIDHYLNPGHYGRLSCTSTPEKANIILNDKPTGKITPFTFTGLMPGVHKVKYTHPMHRADSTEIIVIGGSLNSAFKFLDDTTKGIFYTTNNSSIPSDNTFSVVVDSNNIKWIGTNDEGLVRFDGKNFKTFNKNNSPLITNLVKCLTVDNKNKLWIGLDGGLFTYNGVSFVNHSDKLQDKFITQIICDNNGIIWIATFGGIVKYDGISWTTITSDNSPLNFNHVYSIAIDKLNRLWIGLDDDRGLWVFDGTNWTSWTIARMGVNPSIGATISAIACDRDGLIWVSHMQDIGGSRNYFGGLTRYDGTKWSLISVPQINTQVIQSLYVDRNNFKWVATKNGLGRFDKNNNAAIYTKVNAKLQASYTTSAVLDKNGDLFITTVGGGLSKFRKGYF